MIKKLKHNFNIMSVLGSSSIVTFDEKKGFHSVDINANLAIGLMCAIATSRFIKEKEKECRKINLI